MADQPDKLRLQELADKYLKGTISVAEQEEFDNWFSNDIQENILVPESVADSEETHGRLILARIHGEINKSAKTKTTIKSWPRIAVAVTVIICLSVTAAYFFRSTPTVEIVGKDITPGTNKAILTLANGKQISLSDAKNGQLGKQGSANIIKTADGRVRYEDSVPEQKTVTKTETAYNTITTPKGGQYHLTLSDGTEVWLNAASSVTYPVTFAGDERKVIATGEVYFEVVHNADKPFRVVAGGEVVEDIGTHFNINAYDDEPAVRTTLLEGSVKVSADNQSATIKPGQQVSYTNNNLTTSDADVEEAIAWKNGYFRFNDEKIGEVMKKLSKWYDIDIVYNAGISNEGFIGAISRYKNISQVLKMIAQTGAVKFKVEERRVTVLQK